MGELIEAPNSLNPMIQKVMLDSWGGSSESISGLIPEITKNHSVKGFNNRVYFPNVLEAKWSQSSCQRTGFSEASV